MKRKVLAGILCATIVLTCAFTLIACTGDIAYASSEFVMPQGNRPNFDSLFGAEDKALIDKAVAGNASSSEMKQAVMALYNTANKSRIQTETSLVVQESNAGISMADVIMHAYNLRNGDSWYYQLATSVEPASDDPYAIFLAGIAADFAGYVKVAYTLGDGDYWFFAGKGEEYSCDCSIETFPYSIIEIQEKDNAFDKPYTLDEFNNKVHVLSNSIHEICNVDFSADILADGATITYQDGYYKVTFSVDCKNAGSDWYRKAQEDMKEGNNSINSYEYYDAILEVWDNGYAKSFYSSSKRDAGMASGAPVDKFSYFWDEDEIIELVSTDANLGEGEEVESIDEYLAFARTHEFVNTASLSLLEIILVVVGCIAFVVIAIVVTIEVLVKVGKLPKLAQKRADKKAKRLAKKNGKNQEEQIDEAFSVDSEEE